MGHLGFSWIGAVFLLALFVPNLVWARWARPVGYDASGEPRLLGIVERVGQVLTTAVALVFDDTGPHAWSGWSLWLVGAVGLMAAYEACWMRYFAGDHSVRSFYARWAGVPVPLATLPVTAFVLLGVYGRLLPLVVAALVLAVGHVGIHLWHARGLSGPGA